jgi:hypothetical protein
MPKGWRSDDASGWLDQRRVDGGVRLVWLLVVILLVLGIVALVKYLRS